MTSKQLHSEQLARRFHEAYERLAPSFGYETRPDTKEFDPESNNGRLMIAVCGKVLKDQQAELQRLAALTEALDSLLSCYRCGRRPSGKLLDTLARLKKTGGEDAS